MNAVRARGVILRTRLLTDTSLIVHWLTAEQGRLATVAKGARRPKSPFRGKLDLFFEADFAYQPARRSDLHLLREATVRNPHPALRTSLGALRQAAYAALLIEQVAETETPLPEAWRLLMELLMGLDAGPPRPQTLAAFEFQFLRQNGLQPDLASSRITAGARALAAQLDQMPLAEAALLEAGTAPLRELQRFLHGFLIFHLGRIPSGRSTAYGLGEPPAPTASAGLDRRFGSTPAPPGR